MTVELELRGAHAELMLRRDREVLLEGPVGTGKSLTALFKLRMQCEKYAKSRWLMCRKTRASMTQSLLVTWENKVLSPGHPAINGTCTRAHRASYIFPNGSEVAVGGLDDVERWKSGEYDGILIGEATECSIDDIETLDTRLRNWIVPYQQMILDTNPANAMHPLNLRAMEPGVMHRLLSRHWMNPALYDLENEQWTEQGAEYLSGIAKTLVDPARFAQLFLGQWASTTGLIYPMFDETLHVKDFDIEMDEYRQVWIQLMRTNAEGERVPDGDKRLMRWCIAACDWGFTKPGVMQVWGLDGDQTGWLLAEVYHTEQHQDWWVDRAAEFIREFNIRRIICDPAEPDRIRFFNDRLGSPGGREESRIAIGGNNKVLTGIAHVQALMAPGRPKSANGRTPGPKLFYKKNAARMVDKKLVATHKPWCTVMEKGQYYWEKNQDGKRIREKPDPSCEDHGMDAERYFATWAWRRDMTPHAPVIRITPGSISDLLGHREKLERARRRRRQE